MLLSVTVQFVLLMLSVVVAVGAVASAVTVASDAAPSGTVVADGVVFVILSLLGLTVLSEQVLLYLQLC